MKTFYSHLDETLGRGGTTYLFQNTYGFKRLSSPDQADVIIWNGGEDIGTTIYGENPIHRGIPSQMSKRDREEVSMFEKFKSDQSKLLLGICRGAQLLNCLNGGTLYQDVNGHGGSHDMYDTRCNIILGVTSTHHQQMRPGPSADVIGVSSRSTAKACEAGITHYTQVADLSKGQDVEIVWYKNTRSLCIQGHPEYVPGSKFSDYTLDLIEEFLPKVAA